MQKNFQHYCLILALALLQCLMPLLHAHAGGLHVSSHVHVHAEAPASHHTAHGPEVRVDLCDLPVVCAASEFKRDHASEDFAAALAAPVWLIAPPQAPVLPAFFSSSILPVRPFYSGPPPSQAPPVGA